MPLVRSTWWNADRTPTLRSQPYPVRQRMLADVHIAKAAKLVGKRPAWLEQPLDRLQHSAWVGFAPVQRGRREHLVVNLSMCFRDSPLARQCLDICLEILDLQCRLRVVFGCFVQLWIASQRGGLRKAPE